MSMLIENAHSVKAAVYGDKVFRFCVDARPVSGFPEGFARGDASDFPLEQDGLGILRGGDEGLIYLYDPPTGNFKLGRGEEEILHGYVQAGESRDVFLRIALEEGDAVHGFGAASGRVDCNDRSFRLLNRAGAPGTSSAESSSFPFFMIRRGDCFRGVLLHCTLPLLITVDSRGSDASGPGVRFEYAAAAQAPPVDVFIFHGTPGEILDGLTRLTGRPALPPAWALGYHHAGPARNRKALLELAELFRDKDFPCDALYLDENHLEEERPFTWNESRFPDPREMHGELLEKGIRTIAPSDARVPMEDGYKIYQQGKDGGHYCRTGGSFDYVSRGDAGNMVFPDFTREAVRAWWGHAHGDLFRMGVSGVWNRGGEPELRPGRKYDPFAEDLRHETGSHMEYRNLYGNLFAEAAALGAREFRAGERPFIISRAGCPGIQHRGGMHLEKDQVSWTGLRESLNRLLHLGLSGVPFAGAETGGLLSSGGLFRAKNRELFVRGMELGSILPYFRVQAGAGEGPWSFNSDTREICRKHIRRRYRLLPYLYRLMREAHASGAPVIRPLFYHYPEFHAAETFMLGPDLLAAPVLAEGRKRREVHLPPGEWIEYETGKSYPGETSHVLPARPGYYPLFVRAGAVLPHCEARRNADDSLRSDISLEIHPADEIRGELILDDLNSTRDELYHLKITGNRDRTGNLSLKLYLARDEFKPAFDKLRLRLPPNYRHLSRGGARIQGERINLAGEDRNFEMYEFQVESDSMELEFTYGADWNFQP